MSFHLHKLGKQRKQVNKKHGLFTLFTLFT